MTSLPLHPALVHLPIGVSLILPLIALGVTVAWWRGWLARRAWWAVVLLQLIVLVSAFAAGQTGEQDEERVEAVVPHDALESHEEQAERFIIVSAGLLLLMAFAGTIPGERRARRLAVAATLGTTVAAGLALMTGHAGGELVYRHGAAEAHQPDATARLVQRDHRASDHDDDDDDD